MISAAFLLLYRGSHFLTRARFVRYYPTRQIIDMLVNDDIRKAQFREWYQGSRGGGGGGGGGGRGYNDDDDDDDDDDDFEGLSVDDLVAICEERGIDPGNCWEVRFRERERERERERKKRERK